MLVACWFLDIRVASERAKSQYATERVTLAHSRIKKTIKKYQNIVKTNSIVATPLLLIKNFLIVALLFKKLLIIAIRLLRITIIASIIYKS